MSLENKKVVGMIGIENYDTVLYLSKILSMNKCNVLIVDYSEFHSLELCIPSIDGIDTKKDIIECFGFDYTQMDIRNIGPVKYDITFVYYGFNKMDTYECDSYIYTTDIQKHHTLRIKELINVDKAIQLVIKDCMDSSISKTMVFALLLPDQTNDKYFELPLNEVEIRNRTVFQYDDNVFPSMKRLSTEYISYLIKTLMIINPDFTEKELQNTIKKLEKGKK